MRSLDLAVALGAVRRVPGPAVAAVPATHAPATPVPTPTVAHRPLVPVTDFRAPWTETSAAEVAAVLAGTSERYDALEVVEDQRFKVLAALGLGSAGGGARLVLAPDLRDPPRGPRGEPEAPRVPPRRRRGPERQGPRLGGGLPVRWRPRRGRRPSGRSRRRSAPARAREPDVPPSRYDPATAWTLVAGGDILLDRGVSARHPESGKGVDFPFDGGTVEITSRCRDCSSFGWDLPRAERTGDAGVVRDLLKGADLAMANFENPAPDVFRFHEHGTVFSADPALIEGLANAGIDWVSLANNHIGDAGSGGSSRRWRASTAGGSPTAAPVATRGRPTPPRSSTPAGSPSASSAMT